MLNLTVREHILPMYEEAISSSKTQSQIDRLFDAIQSCHYKNIAEEQEKVKGNKHSGTQIFGIGNCTQKRKRRHLYNYER